MASLGVALAVPQEYAMKLLLLAIASTLTLAAQQTSGSLTDQRIIALVKGGIHEDELKRLILTAPSVNFDLTPAAEEQMVQAGVTDEIIKTMAARESGTTPAPEQTYPNTLNYPQTASPIVPRERSEGRPMRVDVFGGYSFLGLDTNGLRGVAQTVLNANGYSYLDRYTDGLSSRQSFDGWETSVSGGPGRRFAIEGSVAGYYKSNVAGSLSNLLGSAVSVHDYSYLGGARVNFGNAFVHALVGGDTLALSLPSLSNVLSISRTGFATAFGGGLQSKPFARHWAIRASADYVLARYNIVGALNYTPKNIRVSGGIVYEWTGPALR